MDEYFSPKHVSMHEQHHIYNTWKQPMIKRWKSLALGSILIGLAAMAAAQEYRPEKSDSVQYLGSAGYAPLEEPLLPGDTTEVDRFPRTILGFRIDPAKVVVLSDGTRVLSDELIVVYRRSTPLSVRKNLRLRHGLALVTSSRQQLAQLGIEVVRVASPQTAVDLEHLAATLEREESVETAEFNELLTMSSARVAPSLLWAILQERSGSNPRQESELVLAHLGSGLVARLDTNRVISAYDFLDDGRDLTVSSATSEATTASSDAYLPSQPCNSCRLMPLKVFSNEEVSLAAALEALRYTASYDADLAYLPVEGVRQDSQGFSRVASLLDSKSVTLVTGSTSATVNGQAGLLESSHPSYSSPSSTATPDPQQTLYADPQGSTLSSKKSQTENLGVRKPGGVSSLSQQLNQSSGTYWHDYKGHQSGVEEYREGGFVYRNEQYGFEISLASEKSESEKSEFYEFETGYSPDYPLLFTGLHFTSDSNGQSSQRISVFTADQDRTLEEAVIRLHQARRRMAAEHGQTSKSLAFDRHRRIAGGDSTLVVEQETSGALSCYSYLHHNGYLFGFKQNLPRPPNASRSAASSMRKCEQELDQQLEPLRFFPSEERLLPRPYSPRTEEGLFINSKNLDSCQTPTDCTIVDSDMRRIGAYSEPPQRISVARTDDIYIDHQIFTGRDGTPNPCQAWVDAGLPAQEILTDVSFRDYVKEVLVGEWSSTIFNTGGWEFQALVAGGIAVRTYALYAIYHEEGDPVNLVGGDQVQVDVTDNVCDQVYKPHLPNGEDLGHSEAVDLLWGDQPVAIKRVDWSNQFEYYHCAGETEESCRKPNRMRQVETNQDALDGFDWLRIVRKYYAPVEVFYGKQIKVSDRVKLTYGGISVRADSNGQPGAAIQANLVSEEEGTVLEIFDGSSISGDHEIWFRIAWDNDITGWSSGDYLVPLGARVLASPLPTIRILNSSVTKIGRDLSGSRHTYRVTAEVKNEGLIPAITARACYQPLVGSLPASSCLAEVSLATIFNPLAANETTQVDMRVDLDIDLDFGSADLEFGRILVDPERISPQTSPPDTTIGDQRILTIAENYQTVCVLPDSSLQKNAGCSGELDLTYTELGGLRMDPRTNSVEFLMKSEEAATGEPVVSLEDAQREFVRIFLQALAIPNSKHWIDLQVTGPETGFANIPSPFEDTDMADAFLRADVAMKVELFGNSDHRHAIDYWTNLVQQSPYWSELSSIGFDTYPNWTIAATIIPGEEIAAYQTGTSIFLDDVKLGINAGWWMWEPSLDLSGYSLSTGARNDLTQRLGMFRSYIENAVESHAENVLVPAMNSTNSDEVFRRLKSIYTVISLAQWYKEQVAQNPSLPYSHLVDSESLVGVQISPPFDQAYWNDQANQILWEGPCTLFFGPGVCWIFGGLELQESDPAILGALTSNQESVMTRALDDFEAVVDGNDIYSHGGVVIADGPELQITDFAIAEGLPVLSAENRAVQVGIFNAGSEPSGPFRVKLELEDSNGDTSLVGSQEEALSADELIDLTFDWTAPNSPGAYSLSLIVDSDEAVAEGNEQDNRRDILFSVASPFPVTDIFVPNNGSELPEVHSIHLNGEALDAAEGYLEGTSLVWTSDIDGALGTGSLLNDVALSADEHQITLSATNGSGLTGSDSITVRVNEAPELQFIEPDGSEDSAAFTYDVVWTDTDSDNDAEVIFFYDTDSSGFDGVQINAAPISENDETDSLEWDVSIIPEGVYYLYAVIDDGVNPAYSVYNLNGVQIRHSEIARVGGLAHGEQGAIMEAPQRVELVPGFGLTLFVSSSRSNSVSRITVSEVSGPTLQETIVDGVDGAELSGALGVESGIDFLGGPFAFVAAKDSDAIEILDMATSSTEPNHVATIADGDGGAALVEPVSVFLDRHYLYVASSGSDAIEVIDVLSPSSPIHLATLNNAEGGAQLASPHSINISNQVAYIAALGSNALELVDVADAHNPRHISSISIPVPIAVAVRNSVAFVISQDSSIYVVDVADKHNPRQINRVSGESIPDILGPYDLEARGQYLYVVSQASETLSILDIADPENIFLVDSIADSQDGARLQQPTSVEIFGSRAFVTASGSNALEVFDLGPYYQEEPDISVFPSRAIFDGGTGRSDTEDILFFTRGDGALNILGTEFNAPEDFSITANTCQDITLGSSGANICGVTVRFDPVDAGEKRGTLKVFSDDPDESVMVVELRGTSTGPMALTVSKEGDGSGSVESSPLGILYCGDDCSTRTIHVDTGTEVTLVAEANADSRFNGWSGGGCSDTSSCVTTVSTPTSLIARFDRLTQPLNVMFVGNGQGTVESANLALQCTADCEMDFETGTAVRLVATSQEGSLFERWDGDCTLDGLDCLVTMDQARTISARFTLESFDLTVQRVGSGLGSVQSDPAGIDCDPDCSEIFDYGTVVTITATAGADSTFGGWNGGSCGELASCELTIDQAYSLEALFEPVCIDSFETVTGDWLAALGPNDSVGNPVWATDGTVGHSGTQSWHVQEQAQVADQLLVGSFPTLARPGTMLRFWHRFDTESGFDGGVLEYSVDGAGNWFDILAGDGGDIPDNPERFLANGYSATLSDCCANPLPNRAAWSGDSSGWREVIVDLSDFDGRSVSFRWRFGTDDANNAGTGWWIDDVVILEAAICPFGMIFGDGFENGTDSAWSSSTSP